MRASMVAILISVSRTRSASANGSSTTSARASPRHSSRASRQARGGIGETRRRAAPAGLAPPSARIETRQRRLCRRRARSHCPDGSPRRRGRAPAAGWRPAVAGRWRRRGLVAPQDLAQAVVAHHLPAPQCEGNEQAGQPGASNRDEAPEVVDDLERTEYADLHVASLPIGHRRSPAATISLRRLHGPLMPSSVNSAPPSGDIQAACDVGDVDAERSDHLRRQLDYLCGGHCGRAEKDTCQRCDRRRRRLSLSRPPSSFVRADEIPSSATT